MFKCSSSDVLSLRLRGSNQTEAKTAERLIRQVKHNARTNPKKDHMVVDLRTLENIAERISGLLPTDAKVLREEFHSNVRALLEATFARMELVTREEFDSQKAVLRRTREKLERLEARLAELEQSTS